MAIGLSTSATTVNITTSGSIATSLPSPTASQTIKMISGVSGAGDTTLYTVTAGKTLYLNSLNCSQSAGGTVIWKNGVTEIARTIGNTNAYQNMVGIWKLAAGTTLVVNCSAGANMPCTATGWEE